MTTKIKVGLVGATGRMGKEVVTLLQAHDSAALSFAWTHADSRHLAQDSGILANGKENKILVSASTEAWSQADVIIDFGLTDGLEERFKDYRAAGRPVVLCVTGLSALQQQQMTELARHIPLLYAANTSVGINLLSALTEKAARVLGRTADIEILEAHHTRKLDAPSGTALLLGEAAARGRGQRLADVAEMNRNAPEHRYEQGSIGFATLRGGDIVGEHTVYLMVGGERLELTHRVAKRSTFAQGAVRAACWLAEQKTAGFYTMKDALGLDA